MPQAAFSRARKPQAAIGTMGPCWCLVSAVLLALEPPSGAPSSPDNTGDVAEEPVGGAGVSPIEIIPKIEVRESYVRLDSGAPVHDTVAEIDIQFLRRLLLRYEVPYQIVGTPSGQVSGIGDIQLTALGILMSTSDRVVAVILGVVLDTATQPPLGSGKQQIVFGAGGGIKPRPFWIAYGVLQEQISVAGSSARPDVNQLQAQLGSILFGKQYNWIRLELDPLVDFSKAEGQLFGTLEVGSLLIGRVGLFVRAGTQLLGQRQIDYSLIGGIRYLFRLEKGRPQP